MNRTDKNISGIDRKNLDPTADPASDFYQYACGGWMESHPLTPEFSSFGTFNLLRENAREQLKDLVFNLSEDPEAAIPGTIAQKVSDLYTMGMDEERRNREGATPLFPMLERIRESRPEDFTELLGWIHSGISSTFFSTGVTADAKDSDRNLFHIGEGGLSLGDRDFYLEDSEGNRRIMEAFHKYVVRIMTLSGFSDDEAERIWKNVIFIETEMARNKMTREQRRNPLLRYNPVRYSDLAKDYPSFDWDRYMRSIEVSGVEDLNVASPSYLGFITDFLAGLSWQQIQDMLFYDAVSSSTGVLSDDFEEASFELFGKVMSGKEEQEPRWKRALAIPNSMLGEAVGELYVKKYFPEENKRYMVGLVENLRSALKDHIENLSWMSAETKAKAMEKLERITVKIGYPDKWKDYSEITIDPEKSYLENVCNASRWYVKDNYARLGKPVDKEEWHMTPQTVNAYYSPTNNEICFPAGILQPPYFSPDADDALNYGAIGVVIGHEMTHGFDDSGRRFDKNGNLQEWWLPEDAERFSKLASRLEEQFNAVEVAPGVHANGKYTLGENIADQGGLRVALTAYHKATEGKDPEDLDGFSPLQRFYLSYANVWACNIREEEILLRTKTDPHSLGRLRVNETLKNITPFFEAFGIKENDPMFRKEEERVVIW